MTLSSTILLIILFLIVVNNFALEKFYLYKKQNTLKTVYESINNYYKTPGQDNDIQTELEKLSIKNNFDIRSEEHTSELQSQSRIAYAVFCLKKWEGNSRNVLLDEGHDGKFFVKT